MKFDKFKEELFNKAKKLGFSEYEIYYVDGNSTEITIYEGEIDKYTVNSTLGISFRGIYNGKIGYSYTEVMDEDAINLLVTNAKENAKAIENEDLEIVYGKKDKYEVLKTYNSKLNTIEPEKLIEIAKQMEKDIKKQSKLIKNCECMIISEEMGKRIINSKGIDIEHKTNSLIALDEVVVEDKKEMSSAYSYRISNKLKDINTKEIAKEGVEEALSYFNGEPVKSGKYKVILRNDVAATILQTFGGVFSSENTQKGLSLLKGKIGEKIASENVTIVDNPLLENGICSSPFDAEGVATFKKNVIEKGELKTLLYNLKTASKDGIESTANAAKANYTAPVEVAPSNFYIESGTVGREELLKELENGLIITDIAGMHSGANTISGDFSLAAKGFAVENGKIGKPVTQITIASNFYEFLKNVNNIANDIKFTIPSGTSNYGSPSILISEISVAGK